MSPETGPETGPKEDLKSRGEPETRIEDVDKAHEMALSEDRMQTLAKNAREQGFSEDFIRLCLEEANIRSRKTAEEYEKRKLGELEELSPQSRQRLKELFSEMKLERIAGKILQGIIHNEKFTIETDLEIESLRREFRDRGFQEFTEALSLEEHHMDLKEAKKLASLFGLRPNDKNFVNQDREAGTMTFRSITIPGLTRTINFLEGYSAYVDPKEIAEDEDYYGYRGAAVEIYEYNPPK